MQGASANTSVPGPTGRAPTAGPNASSPPSSPGWAYGTIYRNSDERRAALHGWLDHYTRRRPHGSLNRQTPLERLHALGNNVLGSYT